MIRPLSLGASIRAAIGVIAVVALVASASAADVNQIAESCDSCHGKDGVSTDSDVPTIAGFSALNLEDAMAAYKDKIRPCPPSKVRSGAKKGQETDMCKAAGELSDADVKAVAKHYAGKKFVRANQSFDAALAKKGKALHEQHCEKCHSDGGSLAEDEAGILAGQHKGYLAQAFKDYQSGKRPMDKKMKPKMEQLDKPDFDALINYYASFK